MSYYGLGATSSIASPSSFTPIPTKPSAKSITMARNAASVVSAGQQMAANAGVTPGDVHAALDALIQHIRSTDLPVDITTMGRTADEKSALRTLSVQMRKAATQIVDASLAVAPADRKVAFQKQLAAFNPDVSAVDISNRYQTLLAKGGASQRGALVAAIIPELIKGYLVHSARAGQLTGSSPSATKSLHGMDGFGGLGRYSFAGMGGLCDPGDLCPQNDIYPSVPQADATCCADPSWCAQLDELTARFAAYYKNGVVGQGGMMAVTNLIRAMAPMPGQRQNNPVDCHGTQLAPVNAVSGSGMYNGWADIHQSLFRVMAGDPDLPGVLFAMSNEYWPGGRGYPATMLGIPATVTTAIGDFFSGPIGQAIALALAIIGTVICSVFTFGGCAAVAIGILIGAGTIAGAAVLANDAHDAAATAMNNAAAPWLAAGVTPAGTPGAPPGGSVVETPAGVLSRQVGPLKVGTWLAGLVGLTVVGAIALR